jgi:hypothetical protein
MIDGILTMAGVGAETHLIVVVAVSSTIRREGMVSSITCITIRILVIFTAYHIPIIGPVSLGFNQSSLTMFSRTYGLLGSFV